ncbi:hypothetical protein DPMN_006896 [Dreissena polymorpha]|uniref:Uncharacterized protein n=1 Tax=Dreissena polymorpha TaxID=45954 RepID=A0A9D4MW95_DREPO|nr:hypothetical protein DPMN_006896 [Dreissena polymorpha]
MTTEEKKRKKGINSTGSISEIDLQESPSQNKQQEQTPKPQKTRKAKMSKVGETNWKSEYNVSSEINDMKSQLKDINHKLANVASTVDRSIEELNSKIKQLIEKDDARIKNTMRELLSGMKDDIVISLSKQIEVLESRLFEREVENDKLKQEVKGLNKKLADQEEVNSKLANSIAKNESERRNIENEANQYSRSNNVIISGISHIEEIVEGKKQFKRFETAEETTKYMVETLNTKLGCRIDTSDIDIAHRLKKGPDGKKDIIVRFQSRLLRNSVLKQGRVLRQSGIFVREDLTPLNLEVFMSVKRKMSDEVSSVWTRNGVIFFKNTQEQVTRVHYEDYQTWLDLPWSKRTTK